MKSRLLFFVCVVSVFLSLTKARNSRCEPLKLPHCKNINYNETIFPNLLNHTNQDEASSDMATFYPIAELNCSSYAKIFLCSLFFPMCSDYNQAFPPCRHLCEQTRLGCQYAVNKAIKSWPEKLNCDQFPVQSSGAICFGPIQEEKGYDSCRDNVGFTCPSYMKVPDKYDLDYTFMDIKDCSAPCDEDKLMFWEKEKKTFANLWVGCWSFLCLISTLFTVLTYLIDMPRFLYPERPIIFLSGCYMMVSIAYIAGFFLRDGVACRQLQSDYCSFDGETNTCPKVVTQGTREAGCTILFMVVYFFSMASSIWWVMLTVTWFLAAGLKWGHEAIEQKSPYFHGVAWAVPAAQTVAVLISSRLEGDLLSGVCYVGLYSTSHLLWTLLIPLSVYLLTGTAFLMAGFASMFNIRNVVKHEAGINRVEKLEKLMVKIGIFSVLYTVPATVTIACYFYELLNRESWTKGWFSRTCKQDRVPCPCDYESDKNNKPDFIVFIVKYFMTLIVGITSGFWIWSSKTVESWIYFRDRLCCRSRGPDYSRGTRDNSQPVSALYVKDPARPSLYHNRM